MNYKNKKFFNKYKRRHAIPTNSSVNQSEKSLSLQRIDEYNENIIEINNPRTLCCTKCLKVISHSINIVKATVMR